MAIVGAFIRVNKSETELCRGSLDELDGVSTFDVDDPDKMGVLVEAETLNQAHATITEVIRPTPGVLGVWPVYVNTEDEQD